MRVKGPPYNAARRAEAVRTAARVIGLTLVVLGGLYFIAALFMVDGPSGGLDGEEALSYCLTLLVVGVGAIVIALTEPPSPR